MKKIISLLLIFTIIVTGCSASSKDNTNTNQKKTEDTGLPKSLENVTLDNDALHDYIKSTIYDNLVTNIEDESLYVEDIEIKYISKEYIEELDFNSKPNIYFGYTMEELENAFGDDKFVFTLGDNGKTVVQKMEEYDDTYERIIKNIAIGTGVILVCVSVSAVSGGLGAPAVSSIFMASAKSGTAFALSQGLISGVVETAITGYKTGDMNEALKAGALEASEGFKMGAIVGSITGGTGKAFALKKATAGGLTMNEVAIIEKESKYPLNLIREFSSMDEYYTLKNSKLFTSIVDGKTALIQSIDLDYINPSVGKSNYELMKLGKAPFDPATGYRYELHHIGQKNDATLAILTREQHDSPGIHKKLVSEINRSTFATQKKNFWKSFAENAAK